MEILAQEVYTTAHGVFHLEDDTGAKTTDRGGGGGKRKDESETVN